MRNRNAIKIVDIFAGPGGLGEGFSRFEVGGGSNMQRPFQISVSAEKERSAHSTLKLRAFFRRFKQEGDVPEAYYEILRGERGPASLPTELKREWAEAAREAMLLELGPETDRLHSEIRKEIDTRKPWVLIGGPPCQAYSLAGRSRNKGKEHYVPENDQRHFLYREYLKILSAFKPHVFIMENVRGILTSKIHGTHIFETILSDLRDPGRAISKGNGPSYHIFPLSGSAIGDLYATDTVNFDRYLVRAENHGIPQARHRVILLGVRADVLVEPPSVLSEGRRVVIEDVIDDLPKLRSGISKSTDSDSFWSSVVEAQRRDVLKLIKSQSTLNDVADRLRSVEFHEERPRSSSNKPDGRKHVVHKDWYIDPRLGATLNHESRSHMPEDLGRYMYCAVYASLHQGRSPTSKCGDFPEGLAPRHTSWKSGDFRNRFRVQAYGRPASTIVSHISKDGHYFIHPDPAQCRSFTVREAARAQTFPDNYLFLGGRTEQFVQVGNAVPPLLARQIAGVVWSVLRRA